MTIEVMTLITIASVIFGIYSGLKNNKRADTSEIEARAKEQATVNVKLDNIGSDCRDIKQDIGTVKKDVTALSERLIKVEQSVKSAHHRIDELSGHKEGAEIVGR